MPRVFFDMTADGSPVGRIVMEVRSEIHITVHCPKSDCTLLLPGYGGDKYAYVVTICSLVTPMFVLDRIIA